MLYCTKIACLFPAVTSTAVNTLGSQLKTSMSGPCMPPSCLSAAIFMADSIPFITFLPVVDLRSRSLFPKSWRKLCNVWSKADSLLHISLTIKTTTLDNHEKFGLENYVCLAHLRWFVKSSLFSLSSACSLLALSMAAWRWSISSLLSYTKKDTESCQDSLTD